MLAIPTLTLAKHPPLVPTTVLSVGSLVLPPQVLTSFGVPLVALLIRDSTNLKAAAEEQLVLLTAGKLTLSQTLEGRYGFPEAMSVCVRWVERAA